MIILSLYKEYQTQVIHNLHTTKQPPAVVKENGSCNAKMPMQFQTPTPSKNAQRQLQLALRSRLLNPRTSTPSHSLLPSGIWKATSNQSRETSDHDSTMARPRPSPLLISTEKGFQVSPPREPKILTRKSSSISSQKIQHFKKAPPPQPKVNHNPQSPHKETNPHSPPQS